MTWRRLEIYRQLSDFVIGFQAQGVLNKGYKDFASSGLWDFIWQRFGDSTMAGKKTLSAKEVLADIRAGASDEFLIKRYGLTEKGLQSLFKKLVEAKVITQTELDRRLFPQVEGVHEVSVEENEAESPRSSQKHSSSQTDIPQIEQAPGEEAVRPKRAVRRQLSRRQEVFGVFFITYPAVVSLLAWLNLGALGSKSPYHPLGQAIYISLAVVTIGYGLFAVWLLWAVFKPIASRLSVAKEGPGPDLLPDSFLDLDPANRKLALDLMWSSGVGLASREAAAVGSTIMARYGVPGAGWLGRILVFWFGGWPWLAGIGICFAISGSVVKPSPNDQVTDIPWMFLVATASLMFGAFVIASYHFVNFFVDKLLGVVSKVERTAVHRQKLKKLATSFLGSRYDTWFEDMKRSAQAMALSEAGMTPESTFLLFSQSTSLGPDGASGRRNSATYIFSNGYVTAVSNVIFDMEATSYTLVEDDIPTYSISKPNTWNIDEFHYQDVVDVMYTASQDTGKGSANAYLRQLKAMIKAGFSTGATSDGKQAEGFLVLSLVNGGNKQYPATKTAAQGFLSVARSKVREAKERKI